MRTIVLIVFVIAISPLKTLFGQEFCSLSEIDSILVLEKVFMFDFDSRKFSDLDEMYIEDLWIENNEVAKELFDKAVRLNFAPIHERMIIASYLYRVNNPDYVSYLLKNCKTEKDTISVLKIMDSYGIEYSDFNISHAILKKHCPTCIFK